MTAWPLPSYGVAKAHDQQQRSSSSTPLARGTTSYAETGGALNLGGPQCSGGSCRRLSRHHVIDPAHPTGSASTAAGRSGRSSITARTCDSNCPTTPGRSDFSGRSQASARGTVDRPTLNLAGPDAAAHRPQPAVQTELNPPQRSPIQFVCVSSISSVDMAPLFAHRRHWPRSARWMRFPSSCS